MSISAMKQALEALVEANEISKGPYAICLPAEIDTAMDALRQAIEQAEKQEPAFYVIPATDRFGEGYEQTFWEDPAGFPVYTRPVYASDISQEPVDETAKDRHELEEMVKRGTKAWAGTPDDWVDDLRGGAEKQEPDDDIYDVWVEQGTSQENRQVAKNATTERVQVGTRLEPSQDQVGTRIWVGLTDEEIEDIYEQEGRADVVLLTQAKLKEKNVPQP